MFIYIYSNKYIIYLCICIGMLTNNKSMVLDRIHSMLRMLIAGGDTGQRYSLSIGELEKLLGTLISAKKVELFDGSYSLV